MSKKSKLFFGIAVEAATESKYDGSHVGAVIVKNDRIVSIGWNGYPSGANDKKVNEMSREDRLKLAIHAEVNALLNAALHGQSAQGATMYVTHKPCVQCLSKLQNAGIARVNYLHHPGFEAAWCDKEQPIFDMVPLALSSMSYSPKRSVKTHLYDTYLSLDSYKPKAF